MTPGNRPRSFGTAGCPSAVSDLRLGVLASALLLVPVPAFAEQLNDGSVSLDWQAPPRCPNGGAVLGRVRSLVSSTTTPSDQVRARGVVTQPTTAGPWQLTLETVQGARTWQRSLRAGSCEELADAGALIIALLLDPSLQAAEGNDPGSAALSPSPAAAAPIAAPTNPPQAPPSSSTRPAAPPVQGPIPVAATASPLRVPETRDGGLELHAAASAVGDWGSLPRVAAGAEIAVGFGLKPIEVELLAMILPEVEEVIARDPDRGGLITLAAAGLRGCYVVDRTVLGERVCAGFEAGRMQGTGFGTTSWTTESALWVAGRLGVFGRYPLVEPLTLRFGAEALLPVNPPEFEITGIGSVHQPSSVALRLQLGLELIFR